MNPYLLIGLSMACGFVAGYSVCLWRWLVSDEKLAGQLLDAPQPNPAGLNQSVTFTNLPDLPPNATGMLINGKPLSSFYRPPTTFRHAHDCRAEGCTDPQGGSRH